MCGAGRNEVTKLQPGAGSLGKPMHQTCGCVIGELAYEKHISYEIKNQ
jgi:hypothetical protein